MATNATIMIKPVGAMCNIACDYCYYLDNIALANNKRPRMSDDLLERLTREYIRLAAGRPVSFIWQGGEPTLMGLGFFKRAVRLQQRLKRPGQRINNTLQTNGMLLDAAWADFLKEHRFLVGLSLDGDEALHNTHRKTATGRDTFSKALRGYRLLQERDIPCNILCTVNRGNADYGARIYEFFRSIGATHLQFLSLVGKKDNHFWQIKGSQWGKFLNDVFDQWRLHGDDGRIFVSNFESMLASWMDLPQASCIHSKTCGSTMILEHNGDVYCCDFAVGDDYRIGNLLDEDLQDLLDKSVRQRFISQKQRIDDPACNDCEAYKFCHGGCPADRQNGGKNGERNRFCEGYKAFYHHTSEWMAEKSQSSIVGVWNIPIPKRQREHEPVV